MDNFADCLYHYAAKYVKNYDGDTITFDVDLGFHTWTRIRVRLMGIDTPELRGEESVAGQQVRDYVRDVLKNARTIWIHTHGDAQGKYGRWLATVYVDDMNLNEDLLRRGYATIYN